MQFYQNPIDHNNFSTSDHHSSSNLTINSSSRSCTTSNELFSPRSCLSKPIRRRSRISKKTPITLLNADANNFRELVQEFTGCPTPSSFLRAKKGPINLCFELGKEHGDYDEYYSAPLMTSFRQKYHRQERVKVKKQEPKQHQQPRPVLNDGAEVNGVDQIDLLMNEFVMEDIFLDELLQNDS